jgi:hypothetical protein
MLYKTLEPEALRYALRMARGACEGAYVYGDTPPDPLLTVVQAVHSARPAPPRVERRIKLRGFWRLAFWPKEQALVEFGFPGPRIKRYPKHLWEELKKSCLCEKPGEYVILPDNKLQIEIAQELVDLGYLVSDEAKTI